MLRLSSELLGGTCRVQYVFGGECGRGIWAGNVDGDCKTTCHSWIMVRMVVGRQSRAKRDVTNP